MIFYQVSLAKELTRENNQSGLKVKTGNENRFTTETRLNRRHASEPIALRHVTKICKEDA